MQAEDSITIATRGGFVVVLPHPYRGFFRLVVPLIPKSRLIGFASPQSWPLNLQRSGCVFFLLQHGVFVLAEGASSRDYKNSHDFLRHQPVHSSLRSSYCSHNRFFPLPPSLYVYRQSYLTLNRATLMYATGRPSNFYPHEKAFLHLKKGHRRPRTLLRVVAVPTKQYIIFDTASHFLETIAHRSNFHVAFKPEFLGAGSSSYQNNKQRNYQKLRRRQYLSRIELGLSRVVRVAALGG